MQLNDIFLLYDHSQPEAYRVKETTRGIDDYRLAVFAKWENRQIVIKIARNEFTTQERIKGWYDTIEEYIAAGYYCPRIIRTLNGHFSEAISYEEKDCIIYAEEYAIYQTAESLESAQMMPGTRYSYHDDAVRSIGVIGDKHLTTMSSPSGSCIFETYAPTDPCDEVMENALDFKNIIDTDLSSYKEWFNRIWVMFLDNKEKLSSVYNRLPSSVFQADLNNSNILVDQDGKFIGLLDFNLCGRDTVINYLLREAKGDFKEDVPDQGEEKAYYSSGIDYMTVQSLLYNISIVKSVYRFSDLEKESAILLYRYLKPFWWDAFRELNNAKESNEKVDKILAWIENELTRNDIDFMKIMS